MIKSQDYSRELMTIFFARKRTILVTTVLFTLLSLMVAFFWPPTYSAEGVVLVKGKKRETSPEALEVDKAKASLIYEVTKEDLASEMNILASLNVLEKAVHKLGQETFPGLDLNDPESVKEQVASLQEGLKLKLIPGSTLVEAEFLHKDASTAVRILDQIFDEYLQERFSIYNPGEIEDFYREQAMKFRGGIVDLEDQLMAVSRRADTPEPELEIQNNLIIKKDLELQLVLLRNRVVEKQSHVDGVTQAVAARSLQLFSFLPVSSINDMAEKIQSLFVQKANMLSLYRPESQKGQQLEGQIDKAFQSLNEEVTAYLNDQQSQLDGLQMQVDMQDKKLAAITARNVDLYQYQIENGRIEREMELQKQSYQVFVKRWEETKINNTSESNNVFSINILGRPNTSGKPVFPQKKTLIPMGILAGFITGCCFGFLREYFDQTVRAPEDVRYYTDLPTVLSIPDWDGSSR